MTNIAGESIGGIVVRSVSCVQKNRHWWAFEPKASDARTTTDAAGAFEIAPLWADDNEKMRSILVFEHPEYATAWLDANLPGDKSNLNVQLLEPAALAGKVVDEQGAGIAEAVIAIEPNSPSHRLAPRFAIAVGTTDSEGTFLVEKLGRSAALHMNVTKQGYSPYTTRASGAALRVAEAAQEDLLITLRAGGFITGRLVSRGQAYHKEGIIVRVLGPDSDRWTKTDEAGEFEILGLSPGNYTLSAHEPGTFKISSADAELLGSSLVTVEVQTGAPTNVDLELQSGLSVLLQIIESNTAEPLSNHPFRITADAADSNQGKVAQDITDADGEYVVNLAPGDYLLRAESWRQGQYQEISQSFSVTADGLDLTVELAVTQRPMIHGRVVDGDGLAVTGQLWFGNKEVDVDEQGEFEAPEPEGPYPKMRTCFAFDLEQKLGRAFYWEKDDEAVEPEQPLVIVLEPLASIAGRAVDEDGEALDEVQIGIFVRQPNRAITTGTHFTEGKYLHKTVDADGAFRVDGVCVGLPTLMQVSKTGVGAGGRNLGELKPGRLVELGEIVLLPIPAQQENEAQ